MRAIVHGAAEMELMFKIRRKRCTRRTDEYKTRERQRLKAPGSPRS